MKGKSGGMAARMLPAAFAAAAMLLLATAARALPVLYEWLPDGDAVSGQIEIEIGLQDPDNFSVASAGLGGFNVVCPTPLICHSPVVFDRSLGGVLSEDAANVTAAAGKITQLGFTWDQADGNTLVMTAGTLDVIHIGTTAPHTGMFVRAAAAPEPASPALLGAGLAGLGFMRRRRAA